MNMLELGHLLKPGEELDPSNKKLHRALSSVLEKVRVNKISFSILLLDYFPHTQSFEAGWRDDHYLFPREKKT